jgi:hypothetical protein
MSYVFQTWLAEELRAGGCKVKTYRDWKERGRPATSGEFDPFGLLLHHTGNHSTMSNPVPGLSTCLHGRGPPTLWPARWRMSSSDATASAT